MTQQSESVTADTWRQSDETIRNLIAREIWRYQECEESYGDFYGVSVNEGGMKALIKQTALDQAEMIRGVMLESSVLQALFHHSTPSQPAASGGVDEAFRPILEIIEREWTFAGAHPHRAALIEHAKAALAGNAPAQGVSWQCLAKLRPEISDCMWPDCGCEPRSTEIIAALVEQGWKAPDAPAQCAPNAKGDLTKIAAECHRAKWQFDLSEDFQPSKSSARALILQAFHELHRIGDIALKLRDATALTSTVHRDPVLHDERFPSAAAVSSTDGGGK